MERLGLILFGLLLLALIGVDIAMLVSLVKPGDERGRMIVWKASTYTLLGVVGTLVIHIIENFIRGYEGVNPFTLLSATATIYCVVLIFFKRKYGN